MLKVLVVDDEHVISSTLCRILQIRGFFAVSAYSAKDAMLRAQSEPFDVLITDVIMPEMNGIELSKAIHKFLPSCKVILVSGSPLTEELLQREKNRGIDFEIFPKPVHPQQIIDRLEELEKEMSSAHDRPV